MYLLTWQPRSMVRAQCCITATFQYLASFSSFCSSAEECSDYTVHFFLFPNGEDTGGLLCVYAVVSWLSHLKCFPLFLL